MTTKNVLITGGSSGLGKEIIDYMLWLNEQEPDCNFVIHNLDLNPNKKDGIFNYTCDLLYSKSVLQAFNTIQSDGNPKFDIIINNCGINDIQWIDDLQYDDFERLLKINTIAPYYILKQLLNRKLIKDNATIINIVSNASDLAMTHSCAYNASKAALKIMTRQWARELSQSFSNELTVFGISPNKLKGTGMSEYIDNKVCELRGWTKEKAAEYQNNALPCGEETDPKVLAEFICFLLSSKKRHKYLHGCILPYGGPMGN